MRHAVPAVGAKTVAHWRQTSRQCAGYREAPTPARRGQTYGIFFGRDEIRCLLCVDRGHNGLPLLLGIGVMVRENEQGHHLRAQLCERADKCLWIANAHKSDARDADVERQALRRCACPAGIGLRQRSPYDKWAAGCSTGESADRVSATLQSPSLHASKQWHGRAARPVAVHAKYHAGKGLQTQRDCWRRSTRYPGLAARHDAENHRRE